MIHVEDLVFAYRGAKQPCVRSLGFDVSEGEIFGFLGPSGAGKSTTQKILTGLLREYTGTALVMGREPRAPGDDFYEEIGVSFEVPNLYLKLSAIENLRYFAALYKNSVEDPATLLERLDIADEAHLRVSQFSKGMRVRLGFARALLNRPRLLFLDEPTAGLDPVNARRVREIILELKEQGRTVFLTTHDMSVADELCDRVAFMVEGEIRCIESPRTLKLAHGQRSVRIEFAKGGALECREFPLDGLAENHDFMRILRESRVETIHTQETTLERVFIDLTGQELE